MKFSPSNKINSDSGAVPVNGIDTERVYSFSQLDSIAGQSYLFEEALFGFLVTSLQQKSITPNDLSFLLQDGVSLGAENNGHQLTGTQEQSSELFDFVRENFFASHSDLPSVFEHADEDFKKQLFELLNYMKENREVAQNSSEHHESVIANRGDNLNQLHEVGKSGLAHLEKAIEIVKGLENSNAANSTRRNKGQNIDFGEKFGDAKFSVKSSARQTEGTELGEVNENLHHKLSNQAYEVYVTEKAQNPSRLASLGHFSEARLTHQRGTREVSFDEHATLVSNIKMSNMGDDGSLGTHQSQLSDNAEVLGLISTSDADQKGEENSYYESSNQNSLTMHIKDFRQGEGTPMFELFETLISVKDNVYANIRRALEQFVGSNGFSVRISIDSDLVRSVVVQFDRGKVRALVHSRDDRMRKLIADTSDELKRSLSNKGYELVELRFVDALTEDMKNFPTVESVQILQEQLGGR